MSSSAHHQIISLKVSLRGLPPDANAAALTAMLDRAFPSVERKPTLLYIEPGKLR